jgi:putative DNA primase/helicase
VAIAGFHVLSPEKRRELMEYAPKPNGKADAPKQKPLIELMSAVEEEQIDFVWTNRIPRGKLTLFDGDPGVGKSYTAHAIAAALSQGKALPFDKEPEAPLRSLLISAEDGAADTIKPRLRKLGADMEMIGIPRRDMNFTPSQINPTLIENVLKTFPAALIVIDPLIAYANKRNTDRASEVRDMLTPMAIIAEKHRVAIVLIRHLNKATQSKALYRGQGSIDFAAACRSAFVFAQDPVNEERRLMAHAKSSVSGLQPTLEYFISGITGQFSWGGKTSESADEALGTGEPRKEREAQQLDAAKRFLEKALDNGPQPSSDLKDRAEKAGMELEQMWGNAAQANLAIAQSVARKFEARTDFNWPKMAEALIEEYGQTNLVVALRELARARR